MKTYKDYQKEVELALEKAIKENPQFIAEFSKMERPYNPITGTRYAGTNRTWLTFLAASKGYSDPRWMTFKQMAAKGYRLKAKDPAVGYKKGDQTSTEVVYFMPYFLYDLNKDGTINWKKGQQITAQEAKALTKEEQKRLRSRTFSAYLFNADQIDGVEPLPTRPERHYSTALIDHIADRLGLPVVWASGKPNPCYSPKADKVYMPHKDDFFKQKYLYGAGLHELSHATGSKKRLNRDMKGLFGSSDYAFEELVAESSAAMLCAYLGIESTVDDNHKAYIKSWLEACEESKNNALLKAFKLAEEASEYIIKTADLENYQEIVKEETAEAVSSDKKKAKAAKKTAKKTAKAKAAKTAKAKTSKAAEEKKTTKAAAKPAAKPSMGVCRFYSVIEDGIEYVVYHLDKTDGFPAIFKISREAYVKMSKTMLRRIEKSMGFSR